MNLTNTFWKNAHAKKRYVFNQGGTWSSKTYSILQKEIMIATKRQVLTSLVSESYPHLKRGMITDFINILTAENQFDPNKWNKTESSYYFDNGSVMEFFSSDNAGKVHGGRRDRLVFNEIQNNPYEIFYQLSMRTKEQITADYNPTAHFWAHDKYIENPEYADQVDYIHSTYADNPFIPDAVLQDILKRAKTDENFRRVYIEGLPGSLEGLIIKNYELIDGFPKDFNKQQYVLDFGFVNDPSACVEIGYADGKIYCDEKFYKTGLDNIPGPANNPNIIGEFVRAGILKSLPIVADKAEQKSINEIKQFYPLIFGHTKGTIEDELNILTRYPLVITKNSLNLIKEVRSYKWKVLKTGETKNEPIDANNHCIDAIRYGVNEWFGKTQRGFW